MPITGPAASLPKYLNPILRPVARWPSPLALIHHRGRPTGAAYTTPVQAYRTDHVAAMGSEITRAGNHNQLANPHRTGSEALAQLPRPTAGMMRALNVSDFIEFEAHQTTD